MVGKLGYLDESDSTAKGRGLFLRRPHRPKQYTDGRDRYCKMMTILKSLVGLSTLRNVGANDTGPELTFDKSLPMTDISDRFSIDTARQVCSNI